MALSTKYEPSKAEDKWYPYWEKNGFFHASTNDQKEPYCIVMPPPNVTGTLHMGHILNNTIQDVLIRKARMEGKTACWVPGIDHASIATEARVVAMLKERGIKKSDLSRDDFIQYVWEWKEKYGGLILHQLKKLGASCDWERTSFTMDAEYYKAVIKVFVDLYNKGYIYRGIRMIHWDTEAKTALSNEEVVYAEEGEQSVLYAVRYAVKDAAEEWITVATQRPETIMGDVAIAVNPSDKRYTQFIGKKAIVPFIHREVPIIADAYVDPAFGTGCLKITPAHDINDYEIGLRHKLPIIDILNSDGSLNDQCEMPQFVGKDRFVVRKEIIEKLRKSEYLVGEEPLTSRIGRSERTHSVVEPRLSLQWFINMESISKRAYQAVECDEIEIHPTKFKNTYRHWMEHIKDWCISRQLWWGHRIPAYFYGAGSDDFVVAETLQEAVVSASKKTGKQIREQDLHQDPDTLDTWASSWLWPIAVFKGFDDAFFDRDKRKVKHIKGSDHAYFYPTQVVVTAPEILFFWIARMIIAGYEYMDEKPFKNVYLTGIVKDKKGLKMSKSLGNSPDPLALISQYGADGVRTGMLFCSPAGNDLLFDEKLCIQGRNFANKIWNAFRLIKGWEKLDSEATVENKTAVEWFESRLNQCLKEVEHLFAKFRISDALMALYKLTWDDFCSGYLEIIKPPTGSSIDERTSKKTAHFFETLLKLLHPFMPFITEELWHELRAREERDCIIVSPWPVASDVNKKIIEQGNIAFEIISQIRKIRNTNNLPAKEALILTLHESDKERIGEFDSVIKKIVRVTVHFNLRRDYKERSGSIEGVRPLGKRFMVQTVECLLLSEATMDTTKEKDAIRVELEYTKGFLDLILKKLNNENFVKNAPDRVVKAEEKKKADAELKIHFLEKNLKLLRGS